jgi:ribosomal protein S18 acetylase RimI-like enzyme
MAGPDDCVCAKRTVISDLLARRDFGGLFHFWWFEMMKSKYDEVAIRSYSTNDFNDVKMLWQAVFANNERWRAPEFAIPAKMTTQPDLFLVAADGDRVIGTVMAGYDGVRGWFHAVAVLPAYQGRGIGTALLGQAESRLAALGCPKINLQVLPSNFGVVEFYRHLGFITEERICMAKPIGKFAVVATR